MVHVLQIKLHVILYILNTCILPNKASATLSPSNSPVHTTTIFATTPPDPANNGKKYVHLHICTR